MMTKTRKYKQYRLVLKVMEAWVLKDLYCIPYNKVNQVNIGCQMTQYELNEKLNCSYSMTLTIRNSTALFYMYIRL